MNSQVINEFEEYTDIMPLTSNHPKYPANKQSHQPSTEISEVISEAAEWIKGLANINEAPMQDTINTKVSFSAFYASHCPRIKLHRDISALFTFDK